MQIRIFTKIKSEGIISNSPGGSGQTSIIQTDFVYLQFPEC